MICGLSHRKRKEKKADKLSGKQADVTTERFLQFLSSSAWLCIFWIYIDSNKEEREREREREKVRESPFINDTDNLIFMIILSLLHESYIFYYNNILFIYLKKEKILKCKRKKERKKECIMWFVACHIERERKRKQTSCQESRLTSQRNGFFCFWVRLLGYVSFESILTVTGKREKERESERVSIY